MRPPEIGPGLHLNCTYGLARTSLTHYTIKIISIVTEVSTTSRRCPAPRRVHRERDLRRAVVAILNLVPMSALRRGGAFAPLITIRNGDAGRANTSLSRAGSVV